MHTWRSHLVLTPTVHTSCVQVMDVAFSTAVPAMIPTTLILLILSLGSGSTEVILNGLAVGSALHHFAIPCYTLPPSMRSPPMSASPHSAACHKPPTPQTCTVSLTSTVACLSPPMMLRRHPSICVFARGSFVLNLDNRVPEAFLTSAQHTRIIRFFVELISQQQRAKFAKKVSKARRRMPLGRRPSDPATHDRASTEPSTQHDDHSTHHHHSTSHRHSTRPAQRTSPQLPQQPRPSQPQPRSKRWALVKRVAERIVTRDMVPRSQLLTDHPAEALVRFVTTLTACAYGFIFATSGSSLVVCEQLPHFFYYRVRLHGSQSAQRS
jgi:hypothetical protein